MPTYYSEVSFCVQLHRTNFNLRTYMPDVYNVSHVVLIPVPFFCDTKFPKIKEERSGRIFVRESFYSKSQSQLL